MHKENFLSSWLREDVRVTERVAKAGEKNEEGRGEKRKKMRTKRGESKKRRRNGLVSVETFEICGQARDLESCGDLSWWDPLEKFENWSDCESGSSALVRVIPDVTDVSVSPSSVVTELCDVSSCCSDWELVESQSFSFSQKRAHCCTSTQEGMRYESPPLKASHYQEEE